MRSVTDGWRLFDASFLFITGADFLCLGLSEAHTERVIGPCRWDRESLLKAILRTIGCSGSELKESSGDSPNYEFVENSFGFDTCPPLFLSCLYFSSSSSINSTSLIRARDGGGRASLDSSQEFESELEVNSAAQK